MNISINSIAKSKNIVLKQLKDRGFDTTPYENFDDETIGTQYRSNDDYSLDMFIEHTDPTKGRAYVHYRKNPIKKTNIDNEYKSFFQLDEDEPGTLTTNDELHIICLQDENISDNILSAIITLSSYKIYMTIRTLSQTKFDCRIDWIPKHEYVTETEYKENNKLPDKHDTSIINTMSRFDPQAQAIGLRPGQICRIIRPSPIASREVVYRRCIDTLPTTNVNNSDSGVEIIEND